MLDVCANLGFPGCISFPAHSSALKTKKLRMSWNRPRSKTFWIFGWNQFPAMATSKTPFRQRNPLSAWRSICVENIMQTNGFERNRERYAFFCARIAILDHALIAIINYAVCRENWCTSTRKDLTFGVLISLQLEYSTQNETLDFYSKIITHPIYIGFFCGWTIFFSLFFPSGILKRGHWINLMAIN